MNTFLTLDAVRLPPVLASAVSVLLVAGLVDLGRRLARQLGAPPDDRLATCTGFVCLTGIVGAVVHAGALAGWLHLGWLRALGVAIAVCGAIELIRRARTLRAATRRAAVAFTALPVIDRAAVGITVAVLMLTSAATLGPAADIDSLNYHLGVPLEWIRQGGAVGRHEWMQARLVGIGDMLPLLGLAMGTDTIGAVLQGAGLIAAGAALASLAESPRGRVLAWLLVAGSPQAVTLTMTQKPQLLPAVAVVLAIVSVVGRRSPLTPASIWLASGAMMFAVATKYTFLLPATVAALGLLAAARSQRQLGRSLLALTVFALLLPLPVFGRNLWFYGDPMSPFFEARRIGADPVVIAFADYLSSIGPGRSVRDFVLLPFRLVGARSMGGLPTVLGLGLLAFAFTRLRGPTRGVESARRLIAAAVAVSLLILATGRLLPRDFIEVYLLLACAAVAAPRASVVASGWRLALMAQAVFTLCLVTYAAAGTLPAAVSESARHSYMLDAADEYAPAQWVADVVPRDAIVMAELRAAALFERPFVSWEYGRFLAQTPLPETDKAAMLRRLAACSGVTHVAMRSPASVSALAPLGDEAGPVVAGPKRFRWTARNPWSRGGFYDLVVREVTAACLPGN